MAFPSIFIIFVIALFVFQHHLRKNMKVEDKAKDEFWRKEQASLVVRKKEISPEDYLVPDISKLSFNIPEAVEPGDELQLKQLIKRIKELSTHDMMNFSDLTNTDIRIKFGTANQSIITENEYTYNNFLKALASYAHLMNDYSQKDESIMALEECVSLGSDYSDHFVLLGQLYLDNQMTSELNKLKETVSKLETSNKKGILDKLESLTS